MLAEAALRAATGRGAALPRAAAPRAGPTFEGWALNLYLIQVERLGRFLPGRMDFDQVTEV